MPHDSNRNASSSGPTSASAPKTPLSESEFLRKQAADAKAAIGTVINDIKRDLTQGADPRGWMQIAPWTTLAAAAVGGFVAAAVAVPSREEQTLKRLKKIEEALTPRRHAVDSSANGDGVHKVESGQQSFLAGLAGQVLRSVQPVLMSALTAGITAKTVKPDEGEGQASPGDVAYGTPGTSSSGEPSTI